MNRNTWRRFVTRATMAIIPVAAMLTTGATPTDAYSCSRTQGTTVYQFQGLSHADVTLNSSCSDGQMHWTGRVYDDSCDGRAGVVDLAMNQHKGPNGEDLNFWAHEYTTSNGCGTSSSFSGSGEDPGSPWTLSVFVGACGGIFGTNCSTASVGYLSG